MRYRLAPARRVYRSLPSIIKTVINGMTFDGSTTDSMQQAVRDALIAVMAATALGTGRGNQVRPTRRHRPQPHDEAQRIPGREAVP
jgi:hypothetical protein